jgi:starch synthase
VTGKLNIAVVAAERVPLAKVGGLGDVIGALTDGLANRGHTVRCLLPAYKSTTLPAGSRRERVIESFAVPFGESHEPAALDRVELPDSSTEIYLIDHLGDEAFFQRSGVYEEPENGEEYPDNGERFLFFCRAVCEALKLDGRPVDVVHLNDNQTSFVAAFLRNSYAEDPFFSRTATMLTLHNVGYQGVHAPELLELAQIPASECRQGSPYEFYGKVNFLKVGIHFSDLLTTVSERYAEEIRTGPQFGFGLEGVLNDRAADLRGILNGVDYSIWDPKTDSILPRRYSLGDLAGKGVCKESLAREAGWPPEEEEPIIGMVGRLVDQKGLDLIEEAVPDLLKLEARFFILGAGLKKYEDMVTDLSKEHPDQFHAHLGFDDQLAHQVEAGADLFLMPSQYEPCGLNQLISLRYGTVPVVRATGGLADTVRDFDPATREGTGFTFVPYDASSLVAALKRALAIYRQPRVWNALMANGMAQDFSWDVAMTGYESAYRDAMSRAETRRRSNPAERVR